MRAGGAWLNIGLQDALDLADPLGGVLRDGSSEAELDGCPTTRHATGLRVLHHTRAQVAISRNDDVGHALPQTLGPVLTTGRAARRLARLLEGHDASSISHLGPRTLTVEVRSDKVPRRWLSLRSAQVA